MIMAKKNLLKGINEPLFQADHARPKTRREFLAQGFTTGMGTLVGGSLFGSLAASMSANAELSSDIADRLSECGITGGNGKVPFVAFDLAGGCNSSGSNVLVGGPGGQMDFLSTAGYARQGLPGDMVPGVTEATPTATSNGDHTDTSLGLAFHSDSAFLRGILDKTSVECRANVNGFVMAARSDNDTGNNPHNPIPGLNLFGAKGDLVYSVASRNNDMGGGNSRTPTQFMGDSFSDFRPTKVDRRTDALGLVKVGEFDGLTSDEVVAVMETVSRMSANKMDAPGLAGIDSALREKLKCTYVESAGLANAYPDPSVLDIAADTDIQEIFPDAANGGLDVDGSAMDELNDREYQKTAAVMKLAVGGALGSISAYSGAGHVSMGGYDYHGQGRGTGELRDFRAGRCIGAVLEYAHRQQVPVMVAVYSDGSLSANNQIENGFGRGKFMWQSDNSNTRSQFCLVYDPTGRPQLRGGSEAEQAIHQQLGYMNADGNVNTTSSPMANSPKTTADCLVLNYMALHGQEDEFANIYSTAGLIQSLGSGTQLDRYIAFEKLGALGSGDTVPPRPTS